jgi:signal transduction histidine kinase
VLAGRRDELPERSRAALDLLTADVDRFQRLVEDLLEISRYDAGVADLPDRAGQALDLLAADLHRFQRLVEDLLEISRFDAGAVELSLEDVRVSELVRHAVSHRAGSEVPVEVEGPARSAVVRADKRRLERVLVNLVDNAENHGRGVVGVGVGFDDGAVRIAVDDAGPGIAVLDRERVFERFARGSAAGRRSTGGGQGVGLGLALVAEHVRVHGGSVWVEDRPGGGARFVVELPAEVRTDDD